MAFMHRFLCWNLRTSSIVCFIFVADMSDYDSSEDIFGTPPFQQSTSPPHQIDPSTVYIISDDSESEPEDISESQRSTQPPECDSFSQAITQPPEGYLYESHSGGSTSTQTPENIPSPVNAKSIIKNKEGPSADITSFFACVMRLIDLLAIFTDFEISQGFHTAWRSHQWQAFLSSDVVNTFTHMMMFFFSVFMLIQVTNRHFVMYMANLKLYIVAMCIYIFVEFCFSCFEYLYYGMNTFRLAYVVWTWLFWLGRTICNMTFVVILLARKQEINEQTDRELRFAGEKRRHGLGYY